MKIHRDYDIDAYVKYQIKYQVLAHLQMDDILPDDKILQR